MVTIHQMKPFHSRDSEHWLYIYDVYSFTKEICNRSYQIHSIQKESKVNKNNQNTLRLNREQMPQYQVDIASGCLGKSKSS